MILKTKINVVELDGWRHPVDAIVWQPNQTKKLPLVIFCHGVGEAGTDINKLFAQGLPAILNNGYMPPFDFVMVAPQRNSWSPTVQWCKSLIADAAATYDIDVNRVFLTGLSAGGNTTFLSQFTTDIAGAKMFAGIAPLSAANGDIDVALASTFLQTKTPVWSTCGAMDGLESYNSSYVKTINAKVPGLATYTKIPGIGHGGWTSVYDGSVTDASGKSIWDFFASVKTAVPVIQPLAGKKLIKTISLYDDNTYDEK